MKKIYMQPAMVVLEMKVNHVMMTSTIGLIDDYDEGNMEDLAREYTFEDEFE